MEGARWFCDHQTLVLFSIEQHSSHHHYLNLSHTTVRKRNNLTTSVTLLDELPSMTTIVFSNLRQWCYNRLQCFGWNYLWNSHHRNIVEYVTFLPSNYASSQILQSLYYTQNGALLGGHYLIQCWSKVLHI